MKRLDKYLADGGCGTRTQVKKWIREGRVTVNAAIIRDAGAKIDEAADRIMVDGNTVLPPRQVMYMLNKPADVLSATTDPRGRKTVLDFLPPSQRSGMFPVGRLDADTEGLILLTDDGALSHRLLSPSRHVDKTYVALVEGELDQDSVRQFEEGLDIGDPKKTLPARLDILSSGSPLEVKVTIHEGRFHQIKRMFAAIGCRVVYLKRISIGPLVLDETLEAGQYRPLTTEESEALHRIAQT